MRFWSFDSKGAIPWLKDFFLSNMDSDWHPWYSLFHPQSNWATSAGFLLQPKNKRSASLDLLFFISIPTRQAQDFSFSWTKLDRQPYVILFLVSTSTWWWQDFSLRSKIGDGQFAYPFTLSLNFSVMIAGFRLQLMDCRRRRSDQRFPLSSFFLIWTRHSWWWWLASE